MEVSIRPLMIAAIAWVTGVTVTTWDAHRSGWAQTSENPPFMRRLAVDAVWQGNWIGARDSCDFFAHDSLTSRETTGTFLLDNSGYAQGPAIDVTYRIRPRLSVGLEVWYQHRLTAASNPMPYVIELHFGHRDYFGWSGVFEYSPYSRDFSPRRGPFIQGTAGIYQFWDHTRRGPAIVEFNEDSRGYQIAANLGYRIPLSNCVSLSFAVGAQYLLLSGPVLGIRLGGGIR